MKTIALTLAALALLPLSVRAADKDDKAAKLIGKWEAVKGEIPAGSTAEFSKDGKLTVTVKREDKNVRHEATYKFDGDTIKFTATRDGQERTETMKVKKLTDKELVVVDPRGKEVEFKKVK